MSNWLVVGLCGLLLTEAAAWGQVNTATIYGNVADTSGAVVPNAQAVLKNSSTGLSQTAASNTAGEFTFTYLPTGTYDMTVTAAGFQTYSQTGLTLTAGQNVRLPVTLQVGQIRSTVTSNYANSRPNYVGGPAILPNFGQTRVYLNKAAFQLVSAPNGNPVAPGTIGRCAIPGPGQWTVDLSLGKSFKAAERMRLQIRADTFNSFNHPNPGGIVTNLSSGSSGSFGTINSFGFRTMQLGARLNF